MGKARAGDFDVVLWEEPILKLDPVLADWERVLSFDADGRAGARSSPYRCSAVFVEGTLGPTRYEEKVRSLALVFSGAY
jgi:hypothetical protein